MSDLANTELTPEQFAMVSKELLEDSTPEEAAEYKTKVRSAMAAEGLPEKDKAYIQALADALGLS